MRSSLQCRCCRDLGIYVWVPRAVLDKGPCGLICGLRSWWKRSDGQTWACRHWVISFGPCALSFIQTQSLHSTNLLSGNLKLAKTFEPNLEKLKSNWGI